MVRAIIFDCFGVIVGRGFEHTYRAAGGDPTQDRPFIADMLGQANLGRLSEADFHAQIAHHIGCTKAEWQQAMDAAEQPDTELLEYIESLRPKYKTAILSNANHGVVAARVGEAWLERCFDEVLVSAELGMVKPERAMYEHAAAVLGVTPAECVFFDDSSYHVEPAKALGMQAFVYTNLAQAQTDLQSVLGRSNPKHEPLV